MHSDQLLAALLSSPHTVFVSATRDGLIDTWSCGAEALYGWSADQAVGQPLSLLAPPERAREQEVRLRLFEGQQLAPFETVRRHRDGTDIPVELHLVPVRDPGGAVVGTAAVHRDLRRARTAEGALEASQDELRARFADSPVAQSRLDLTGRTLAVNAAMEQLLGREEGELVGQDVYARYVEEDRSGLEGTLADLAAGRISYVQQEQTLRRADGALVPVVMTVTLVHDAQGRPLLAGSVEDVTALREAEQRLRSKAARHEALLETMPVIVFTYDREGICTSSRGSGLRHFGLVDDQSVGADLLELYASRPALAAALADSLAGRPTRSTLEGVAGHVWAGHYRPMRGLDGEIEGGIGIAVDVTAQVSAEREVAANEARLVALLRHASDVALVVDLGGRIVYASPAVRAQLGYDEADLFWTDASSYNHPDDRRAIAAAWRSVLQEAGASARFECRVRHADGTWRWAEHVFTNLAADPAVGGVVVNIRETTDRRRAEEELRRLALQDGLTGLANRALLLDRAERSLAAGRRTGAATGLVLLDVVAMARINDQVGHAGGDALLQALAARLGAALRTADTLARVGGASFAVLAEDVSSEEDLRVRAAELVAVAGEPVELDGQVLQVGLQVGTALSPVPDAGALLAAAERTAAVNRRPSRVAVAPPPSEVPGAGVGDLRRALREGELRLQYQPVVDVFTGRPTGVEALVRWDHPERGLLQAQDVVPLAESSGLAVDLGAWVLRQAIAQLAAWRDRDLNVAVNLSPQQLVGEELPALLRGLLAEYGAPVDRLVLEVTESALMDDPGTTAVLEAVREMGVHLALDDFGTGYSSLTYLKRFPVEVIKVDRSFVAGLGLDADDDAIVASIVSLAHSIGKLVVAEGVETPLQLEVLQRLGVRHAQGFLWSRPLLLPQLERWLEQVATAPVPPWPAAPVRPRAAAPTHDADHDRILELHRQGASLHTVAAALNAEGRRTAAGPRWTPKTVARVVAALVPPG